MQRRSLFRSKSLQIYLKAVRKELKDRQDFHAVLDRLSHDHPLIETFWQEKIDLTWIVRKIALAQHYERGNKALLNAQHRHKQTAKKARQRAAKLVTPRDDDVTITPEWQEYIEAIFHPARWAAKIQSLRLQERAGRSALVKDGVLPAGPSNDWPRRRLLMELVEYFAKAAPRSSVKTRNDWIRRTLERGLEIYIAPDSYRRKIDCLRKRSRTVCSSASTPSAKPLRAFRRSAAR